MSKTDDLQKPADTLPFSVTLHVRDTCLCLHLQRAARAVGRKFDEVLRPVGLTNGQFSLLMSLNRPEPPLMRDVASLLAMDRTTLTAMLKPLARRGLLEIAADESDRRGRRLELLPEGRELLAKALPLWTRTEAEVEGRLASGNAELLRDDLRSLS
jgi:DNA-binding MarR family transcriptional regulator